MRGAVLSGRSADFGTMSAHSYGAGGRGSMRSCAPHHPGLRGA